MIIKTTFVQRVLGLVLGIALAGTTFMPGAQAQTISELQAQIAALMAQIAALQQGSASSNDACPYTWTRPLTIGSSGADVLKLQQFLNASADTRLAVAGAGAPGMETQYFGPITAAAVSKFQTKYRADILTPLGLANATGYFGASSMAKANALCLSGGPSTPPSTGGDELRGNSGSLEGVDYISSINNEKVGEGQNDVEVLGLALEADDGSDLRLTSIRVSFEEQNAGGSDDFDDYAREVTVWLDGDEVGSIDVDDLRESRGIWYGSISLDRDAIIRMGDEAELVIAVSALKNIDSSDLGSANNEWRAGVTTIRYEDGRGSILSETSRGDIISNSDLDTDGRKFYFDTFASAAGVELRVSESDDNPSAGSVQVDRKGGDKVVLLVGELRGRGSDIEISKLAASITPTGASVEEIASRFILAIDGDEVDFLDADRCSDVTDDCSNDDGQTATYIFDDFEYTLDEDDTVDFEIIAELEDFGGDFTEGDALRATVDSSDIEAEDESGDDLSGSELRGVVNGEDIRFLSTGISVKLTDSTESSLINVSNDSSDDQGRFILEFDVTAFEDTAWIELNAGSSTDAAADNLGVAFSVENASTGDVVNDGTAIALLSRVSGGSVTGNFVRISSGQTATLRLTVYYDATATGLYRVQMNEIGYNQTSAAAATEAHELVPAANFESGSVQVMN